MAKTTLQNASLMRLTFRITWNNIILLYFHTLPITHKMLVTFWIPALSGGTAWMNLSFLLCWFNLCTTIILHTLVQGSPDPFPLMLSQLLYPFSILSLALGCLRSCLRHSCAICFQIFLFCSIPPLVSDHVSPCPFSCTALHLTSILRCSLIDVIWDCFSQNCIKVDTFLQYQTSFHTKSPPH